jgi:DivIVA domain-containing protein
MAQSEIRGDHSSIGNGGDTREGAESGAAKPERETRTVTGHPESHVPRERDGNSAPAEGPDRPTPRFQSNRMTGAEREKTISDAREVRFPVALRGYDRAAVDRYVREVNRVIAELEISSSPEMAVRHALDEVSEETREILQRAHQSAEELTARSRARADERLEQAEREAQELRETTQREAEETRGQAASEAAETRERAATEARELRETAAAEAHELRETTAQEAERVRQNADHEAQRLRTTAQREADDLRAATRREAEETIEHAETRARELGHSAETIWRERRRLIEDVRGAGEQLVAIGDTESKRFPRFAEDMALALEPLRGHQASGDDDPGEAEPTASGSANADT